ncbi:MULTISPECIES: hypothetical protein [Actinomycetes]|nr:MULTISPECIES: hypothetical protein [Actinomycetes]
MSSAGIAPTLVRLRSETNPGLLSGSATVDARRGSGTTLETGAPTA